MSVGCLSGHRLPAQNTKILLLIETVMQACKADTSKLSTTRNKLSLEHVKTLSVVHSIFLANAAQQCEGYKKGGILL